MEKVGIGFAAGIFIGIMSAPFFVIVANLPSIALGWLSIVVSLEGVLVGAASIFVKNTYLNVLVGAIIGAAVFMILSPWYANYTALALIGVIAGSITAYSCGLYKPQEV